MCTLDYNFFLKQLKAEMWIDETRFNFSDDSNEEEHYISFLPEYEKPYRCGYCDIPDDTEYESTEKLVNAPTWNEKSLKERWSEVCICHIEGCLLKIGLIVVIMFEE